MKKEDLLNLELGGSENFSLEVEGELEKLTGKFYKLVAENAKSIDLVSSGQMISNENFKSKISYYDDITIVDFSMIEYADYQNQGVQGVKDNKNAPDSPYKFKKLGMSEKGRKSILKSIEDGKIKISDTSKTKYGKIGLETRAKETPNQKEINEREAARIAYLVKAYGIKSKGFIDKAWEEFTKDLGTDVTKLLQQKVLAQMKIVFV